MIRLLPLLILFLGFIRLPVQAQNKYTFSGFIKDSQTEEALPFVNVRIVDKFAGTMSTADGYFSFTYSKPEVKVLLSYVGYESQQLTLSANHPKPYQIELKPSTHQLEEVVVLAGENPAHRIIRNAVDNRRLNDHTRIPAYRYVAYNKLTTTTKKRKMKDDSKKKKDTPKKDKKKAEADSVRQRLDEHLSNHHLFLSETIVERKYKHPGKLHETVLASRMSGYKDPLMAASSNNFQPLSFYDDFVPFFEQNYLSPISRGSTRRYYFELEDTLIHTPDSVYIISFVPKEEKGFFGMSGKLHISTDQYAIQFIQADFHDPQALAAVRWEQSYERVNGEYWFPVDIKMTFQLQKLDILGKSFLFNGESLLTQIVFPQEISKKEFGIVNLEVTDSATQRAPQYWEKYRQKPLTKKDQNTYQFLDSVSDKSGLNKASKWVRTLMTQRLEIGKMDIMLDKVVSYNSWEGVSPGMGISTNQKLSTFFDLTGWFRYGVRDDAFKYGARLRLDWNRRIDLFTAITYRKDLNAAGQVKYDLDHRPWGNADEGYRNFFAERMENVEEVIISTGLRPFPWPLNVFLQAASSIRRPLYDYGYGQNEITDSTSFHYSEITAGLSYYHNEKYISIGKRRLYAGYQSPTANLLLTRGLDGPLNGDFAFWKVDLRFRHRFNLKGIGNTNLGLYAGKIWGNLPYSRMYTARADGMSSILLIPNIFQTAGYYEFAGSEFVNLFITHNFGRLIHRSKHFRPELIVAHNIGFSRTNNPTFHHAIAFKSMDKGFYETGLLFDNLYRVNYFNMMYLGFGGGLFMRHGPYQLPKLSDNFAYKISLKVSY